MNNVLSNIAAVGTVSAVGDELVSFRRKAVASDNAATPLARVILAAMVAGSMTAATVTAAVLHSFGNPKTPKGKVLEKLSGSGDHVPGFGATRKTIAAILDIFENIDADKARDVEQDNGETVTIGDGAVRSTVYAFILNATDAPKSLRALREAVRSHIAAFTAATMPDNSDATADAEQAQADATGAATDAPLSLSDMVNRLNVAYLAATPAERIAAHEAITAFFVTVDDDIRAAKDAETADASAENKVLEPAE